MSSKRKKKFQDSEDDECSLSDLDQLWESSLDDWVEIVPDEYSNSTLIIEKDNWEIEDFKREKVDLKCMKDECMYRKNFYEKEDSFNLSVRTDDDEYFVFNVLDNENKSEILMAKHSVESSEMKTIPRKQIKVGLMKKIFCQTYTDDKLIQLYDPELKGSEISYCSKSEDEKDLLTLTEYFNRDKYKIGIVYVKEGQLSEKQYLWNKGHSQRFEDFLSILGSKEDLLGFGGFSGGLDIKYGSCGEKSLYTQWNNSEIMFHVSTLIPFDPLDKQQIIRKRHIGNNSVMVVFLDGNVKFDPDSFVTKFIHVIIVVRVIQVWGKIKYRVEVTKRKCVPDFLPLLPTPPIFEKDQLREFLLTKICQAERTALGSGTFLKRYHFLRADIIKKIYKRNLY
ncbi:rap gtpase-activating protein [Anaeramoeba flamelloides]|uniref:Rap gtpase-activating protein n=1 Tax=Anaeramoeba flamelloides TaxID=1746091 RepID=A0ABQ8XI68_9EUKA|nr:rap gtpase-activating protein [Anaeramoeba flamelloides]